MAGGTTNTGDTTSTIGTTSTVGTTSDTTSTLASGGPAPGHRVSLS
jgi:hypothetical protein